MQQPRLDLFPSVDTPANQRRFQAVLSAALSAIAPWDNRRITPQGFEVPSPKPALVWGRRPSVEALLLYSAYDLINPILPLLVLPPQAQPTWGIQSQNDLAASVQTYWSTKIASYQNVTNVPISTDYLGVTPLITMSGGPG